MVTWGYPHGHPTCFISSASRPRMSRPGSGRRRWTSGRNIWCSMYITYRHVYILIYYISIYLYIYIYIISIYIYILYLYIYIYIYIYIIYLYIEKYICVFLFFFFFFFFRAIGMVCENLCETNSEHRRPSVQELLVAEL